MGTIFGGEKEITVAIPSSPEQVETLITLFETIAHEEGWQPGEALRTCTDRSAYFALWIGSNSGEELAGGLQIVRPDKHGSLPCQSIWPEISFAGRTDVAHIAVMALQSQWRGKGSEGGLFWLLAIAMWRYCLEENIKELWLEATPRTLRCYQRLGWPLHIQGELRLHWGEPCYLCSLSVREVAGALVEKATRSPVYRRLLEHACCGTYTASEELASATG